MTRQAEFKIGIMLQQPVVHASLTLPEGAEFVLTDSYRDTLPFSKKEFEKRREQGHLLYELMVEGIPVSYGWLAAPGVPVGILHELNMRVPDHALYIWDCATPPQHRGKGYFQILLKGMIQSQGPQTSIALVAVDSNNTASRAALKRVGFQPLFTYWSCRLFGKVILSQALKDGKLTWGQVPFDRLEYSV